MTSLTEKADALVKGLHPYLSGQLPIVRLRSLGWFDFINNDRPLTDSPATMACEAFLYLTLKESNNWDHLHAVLVAIIAFLKDKYDKHPSRGELIRLKTLLETCPVDSNAVLSWFEQVYG